MNMVVDGGGIIRIGVEVLSGTLFPVQDWTCVNLSEEKD